MLTEEDGVSDPLASHFPYRYNASRQGKARPGEKQRI